MLYLLLLKGNKLYRHQNGSREGTACLREELTVKKCFAQVLCPDQAMLFYGEYEHDIYFTIVKLYKVYQNINTFH